MPLRQTSQVGAGIPGALRPGFLSLALPTPVFPQAPLDARIELNLNGWTSITPYALQRDGTKPPIDIQIGRQTETSSITPARMTMQWNNRAGQFSPRNPLGPYFGLLGRNTPLRVSVPDTGVSLRQEDDQASYVLAFAPSVTGNLDLRIDLQPSGYYSAQLINGAYQLFLNNDGSLTFGWTDNSSVSHFVSTSVGLNGPIPLGRVMIRVTLNITTGAVSFWTAPNMNGTQTLLASFTGAGATSIQSGGDVAIGGPSTGGPPSASTSVTGRIYEVQIYSGATLVAGPAFFAQTPGVTSFTDSQGNTWFLHGSASIDNRCYLTHQECSSLPQQWDTSGTDVWTPVQAGGVLRRLQQGNAPLNSAFRRAVLAQSGNLFPAAYWPCEDEKGSQQIASGLTGGVPMGLTGVPGFTGTSTSKTADTNFPCSAQLPQVAGSTWTGTVLTGGTTWTDNVTRFLLYETAGTLTNGNVLCSIYTTGTVGLLRLIYNTGGDLGLAGFSATGTSLFASGPQTANLDGNPVIISVDLLPSGANVIAQVQVMQVGQTAATTVYTFTVTSATVGAVTQVIVNPPGPLNTGMGSAVMGHVSVQGTWQSLANLAQPLNAWTGEPAGMRFARLCAENGINGRVYGFPATTGLMGAQPIDTLANLLQYCEDTDRGQLYDPQDCLGIGYRTLASMQNQPAGVSLNYAGAFLGGDGSPGLTPTDDDQYTANDVTASRSGGSDARVQILTGDMSIQPPPNGVGDYAVSKTVYCQSDSQLPNIAGWMAWVGTCDQERYPVVPMNLARSQLASLTEAIQNVKIGDHVQITNPPAWLPPGNIDQLVYGMNIKLAGFFYQISWNTVPELPYEVARAGTNALNSAHAQTAGSELAQPAGSALNSNPFFAGGSLAGWSGFLGTISADNSATYPGGPLEWSAVFSGIVGGALVGASFPTTVGNAYGAGAYVFFPAGGTVQIGFNWNNGGTFVSQLATTVTVPAGVWTAIASGSITAPAGTNNASVVMLPNGTLLAAQAVVAWATGTLLVQTTAGAVWTTATSDFPFDLAIGGERMTATSIANQSNSVTSPAALANVIVWNIPAGTYTVYWSVTLSGTLGAGDANNFGLYNGSTLVATSVNLAKAGTYPQKPQTFTVTSGAPDIKILTGTNTPTTGSTYAATISNPQTFTVVRSVNGISKTQADDAPVSLYQVPVAALAGVT